MTAATLSEVLRPAMEQRYAVAGLVVLGWEDALAYTLAAEEAGIPIILQAGPGCRRHTPIAVLGKMLRHLADTASVPIVCHVDHAYSIEECREGIDSGFTSVMYDGSGSTIDENIEATARIVELARLAGVSVEGEVGIVGYAGNSESVATAPEEAARFERETGADALAVSVGNVHLQSRKSADLNMAAIHSIEAATTLPLVLHGASGIASDHRRHVAQATRVCKFNIGTELRMIFGQALRCTLAENPAEFDRIALLKPSMEAMKIATAAIIRGLRFPDGTGGRPARTHSSEGSS